MDVRREPRWSRWALVAACALGGVLYGWALGSVGYGNSYYAAAARSMSQSWSNFFFGAFDPLGVSTVDKPPGALWVQALSGRLFGYHGLGRVLGTRDGAGGAEVPRAAAACPRGAWPPGR
ncbi:hypothetical protein [Streptosporangium roseum]|uniref:hypothetical protein n=1 Tax=Streptosporangium roseum TaxID=2001 RepID=UPI003321F7F3